MDLRLKGKYALITGGSHGIGLAIALQLAEEKCNIAICSRNESRISQAVDKLKKTGVDVIGLCCDVLHVSDIEKVMAKVKECWGTLHILINNVGGGGRWGLPSVEETPENIWKEVYEKNAGAAIRFTCLALPFMRKQKWGRVVTIGSIYGREGGGRPWFNMAKSAEVSLMKSLSLNKDLVRDGITFNCIAPGSIMIPDTGWEKEEKESPKKFKEMLDQQFPLGRLGTPEEVASVVAFVCSEQASYLNGACIPIDGSEGRSF